jgi:hypothetical protein
MTRYTNSRFSVGSNSPDAHKKFTDNWDAAFGRKTPDAAPDCPAPDLTEFGFSDPPPRCQHAIAFHGPARLRPDGMELCERCGWYIEPASAEGVR